MDQIESKIKVIRSAEPFKWVKSLVIKIGSYTLTPEQREDEINAIIMLSCFSLMQEQNRNPQALDPYEILKYGSQYITTIFSYYCQYYLMKNSVVITPEILQKITEKLTSENLPGKFEAILMKRLNNDMTPSEISSSISAFSFETDAEPTYVKNLVSDLIIKKHNVEEFSDLQPGMSVAGTTLVSLVIRKTNSEVWKASYNGRPVAVKLQSLGINDGELKKLVKNSNFERIVSYIKETDQEYLNYIKLKEFLYKVRYFKVDFYNPLSKKVKIMSWLDGPIDKVVIENKKEFLKDMVQLLYELHKTGFVFNNINPHHIMVDNSSDIPNKYRLVDYKNLVLNKGIDTQHEDHYRSLSLITGAGIVTPYDDIESLLYIFNDLISGKLVYTNTQDEVLKKTQLSSLSALVSEAIMALRLLKQQDPYASGLDNPPKIESYVDEIYKTGINGKASIISIILNLIGKFNEVADIAISLSGIDLARLKNIRNQLGTDPRFSDVVSNPSKFNDLSIKILNFMTKACQYGDEDQNLIIKFLQ